MNTVDLHADIVPGEGAAGFQLGSHLTQVRSIFARVRRWDRARGPLREAVAQCDGWLMASVAPFCMASTRAYYPAGSAFTGLAFGADVEPVEHAPSQRIFGIYLFSQPAAA